jgi:hypothetical protein
MTYDELARSLRGRVSDVLFCNSPKRETARVTKEFVAQAWESGTLPVQCGDRQWVVGWIVAKTFFTTYLTPIKVGPKKPRLLRESYFNQTSAEPGV